MKLATVTYNGEMRSHYRKGPSGERYHFDNPPGSDPIPVAVGSVEDARSLADQDVFEVEWTAVGHFARTVGESAKDAGLTLKDMSYRQKQKLVSTLDLDVAGNAPEDKLDQAIKPAVDELRKEMELEEV